MPDCRGRRECPKSLFRVSFWAFLAGPVIFKKAAIFAKKAPSIPVHFSTSSSDDMKELMSQLDEDIVEKGEEKREEETPKGKEEKVKEEEAPKGAAAEALQRAEEARKAAAAAEARVAAMWQPALQKGALKSSTPVVEKSAEKKQGVRVEPSPVVLLNAAVAAEAQEKKQAEVEAGTRTPEGVYTCGSCGSRAVFLTLLVHRQRAFVVRVFVLSHRVESI